MTQLDEMPLTEMMMPRSSSYMWQWKPASDLGTGGPVLTTLNRIAFGSRPADFEGVQQIGIDAYIKEQLAPEKIDDSALEQGVAGSFPTLNKTTGELMPRLTSTGSLASSESRAFQRHLQRRRARDCARRWFARSDALTL